MALGSLEIITALFVMLGLIKIIVVLTNRKGWYNNVVKPIYSNKNISTIIFLILAIVIFYYLLKRLSIVEIFAVLAFSSILIGIGLMQYSKDLLPVFSRIYDKRLGSWKMLNILIWLALLLWALYEIFLI